MDYKKITMDDIRDLIESSYTSYNRYNVEAIYPDIKKWPEGYIVDEEKSVKWNREQVEVHNKEVNKAWTKYRLKCNEGHENFNKDLKKAIQNDYKFNEAQADVIISYLYNEGMYDDLCRAENLCEVVSEVLQANN